MLNVMVNTKQLEDSLKKLEVIIPKKPKMKGLKCIRLEVTDKVKLVSTDLKNIMIGELEDVIIESEGEILLSDIKDLMRSFKFFTEYQTRLEETKNTLKITNGDKVIEIMLYNLELFPDTKITNEGKIYNYRQKKLYDRIMKVSYAMGNDPTRTNLNGIRFDNSVMVALDGYRLALSNDSVLSIDEGITVESEAIEALRKTLGRNDKNDSEMEIIVGKKYISFIYQNITLISKLNEGIYFDYKSVIDTSKVELEELELDRRKLEDDLKFLFIHSKVCKFNTIKLEIKDKIFKYSCNTESSIVSTELEIDKDIKFINAMNNKYLLDALKVIKEDDIKFQFSTTYNPVFLKDSDSTHMILPIRLNEGV